MQKNLKTWKPIIVLVCSRCAPENLKTWKPTRTIGFQVFRFLLGFAYGKTWKPTYPSTRFPGFSHVFLRENLETCSGRQASRPPGQEACRRQAQPGSQPDIRFSGFQVFFWFSFRKNLKTYLSKHQVFGFFLCFSSGKPENLLRPPGEPASLAKKRAGGRPSLAGSQILGFQVFIILFRFFFRRKLNTCLSKQQVFGFFLCLFWEKPENLLRPPGEPASLAKKRAGGRPRLAGSQQIWGSQFFLFFWCGRRFFLMANVVWWSCSMFEAPWVCLVCLTPACGRRFFS